MIHGQNSLHGGYIGFLEAPVQKATRIHRRSFDYGSHEHSRKCGLGQ